MGYFLNEKEFALEKILFYPNIFILIMKVVIIDGLFIIAVI